MILIALRLVAFTAIVIGCVNTAAADERKHPIHVIGGMTMPSQAGPSGESSEVYTKAPGGASIGWMLGGGIRLARAVGIEAISPERAG